MLARPARASLEVQSGAPLCRPLLVEVCVGRVDGRRAKGKILLHGIGHAGLWCAGQQYVLGGMGRAVVLDGGAVIGGGEDSIRRLTAEHVLWRFRAAGVGRLRGIRVVS